jgi:hypothetical protein
MPLGMGSSTVIAGGSGSSAGLGTFGSAYGAGSGGLLRHGGASASASGAERGIFGAAALASHVEPKSGVGSPRNGTGGRSFLGLGSSAAVYAPGTRAGFGRAHGAPAASSFSVSDPLADLFIGSATVPPLKTRSPRGGGRRQTSGAAGAPTATGGLDDEGECSFMYRYILRESCSQFDSLPPNIFVDSADGDGRFRRPPRRVRKCRSMKIGALCSECGVGRFRRPPRRVRKCRSMKRSERCAECGVGFGWAFAAARGRWRFRSGPKPPRVRACVRVYRMRVCVFKLGRGGLCNSVRRRKVGVSIVRVSSRQEPFSRCVGGLVMETTHGRTHSENGEGECWWSRIASPYPDANKERRATRHQ